MANPTTNYGFVLPTSSDLVTDLPADFDVALQGVDTRLKALNPSTTLGDIEYASATANTNTRLALGTAGQVLTVNGGATAPEWATPASGAGLTFIKSQTVGTSVSSVAVTSAFSASYDNYLITFTGGAGSASGNDLSIQFGATTSGYAWSGFYQSTTSSTITGFATNSASNIALGTMSGEGAAIEIFVTNPFLSRRTSVASRGTPLISGDFRVDYAGRLDNSTSYTDFTILTANTMTGGTIRVYGYQNS